MDKKKAEKAQARGKQGAESEEAAAAAQKPAQPVWNDDVSQNAAVSADGRIMLNENVEIFPNRPRPDLSSPGIQVFEAKDRRGVGEHVAYLCGRSVVPRVTSIGSYKNLKNTNILKLADAGIVEWTPENRQRFALVFERPPARKFIQPDGKPYRISEDRILPTLVQPVLSVLADLANIDLIHGAINPQNIFFSGAEGAEAAMLGECLSSMPSLRQPALFEPIERAMAQPSGRGPGTSRDDLYAFGICVAMAVRGENLLADRTPEQLIHDKLSEGSYSLVVGRERIPGGISEFLRGVLSDDEQQRWDIEEAVRWLEGRRLSPKQPRAHLRAARPFIFQEEKYWDLPSIAHAFSCNVAEAAGIVEQDQFDLWIKRNFEDKDTLMRFEGVWEKEKGSSREKLVASACMALDPRAPVRYKGLSVFPSGMGNALAEAIAQGDDIQVYGEIVSQQMFGFWASQRTDDAADAAGISAQFEKCRNYLGQKITGYGMERVLYALNRECVCVSPILRNFFVLTPGRLLLALERIARQGNRPETVLDRHMVAFISVREPKMVDPHLGHIISHDRGHQIVGIIRTLAAIQKRFNVGPVPGVTAWMVSLSGPAIDRFNDRDLRQDLSRRLDKVKDSGSLAALLDLIDDSRVIQDDAARFQMARGEYALLVRERDGIEGYLRRRRSFGFATGRQIAMIVSSVLSTLIILGYLIFYFTRGMF